jgi:hypothetical protein
MIVDILWLRGNAGLKLSIKLKGQGAEDVVARGEIAHIGSGYRVGLIEVR